MGSRPMLVGCCRGFPSAPNAEPFGVQVKSRSWEGSLDTPCKDTFAKVMSQRWSERELLGCLRG